MKFTRLVSLVLVFVMSLSMTAFAADKGLSSEALPLVTEVNGIRTAVTYDAAAEYTVTYDTIKGAIQYSERNLVSNRTISSNSVEISTLISDFQTSTPRSTTMSNR